MSNKRKKQVVKRVKNSGKIKNATSLIVDGLTFKSKLEKFTYDKLIEHGITNFKYEEDKFVLIPAFTYTEDCIEMYERTDRTTHQKHRLYGPVTEEIRPMTYLPDFTCINDDKTGWLIEVKGYANDAFPNKWKLFKQWLMVNGYKITLYKPNNQGNVLKTIEMIKNKFYKNGND